MKLQSIILSVYVVLFLSCSAAEPPSRTKNVIYRIQPPKAPWESLSTDRLDADYAFQNPKTGSSFYIHSICNIYQDASLDQLTTGLVRLFDNPKIIESKTETLANRAAKISTLSGEMDGAPVSAKITVLKKNSCNFDFVYIGIPKFFRQDMSEYEKFVNSFNL